MKEFLLVLLAYVFLVIPMWVVEYKFNIHFSTLETFGIITPVYIAMRLAIWTHEFENRTNKDD